MDISHSYRSNRHESSPSTLSQSLSNQRTPTRSFYHRSFHGHNDTGPQTSESVREETAELASFAMSDAASMLSISPNNNNNNAAPSLGHNNSFYSARSHRDSLSTYNAPLPDPILEVSESGPPTPVIEGAQISPGGGTSVLTELIRNSPPNGSLHSDASETSDEADTETQSGYDTSRVNLAVPPAEQEDATEQTSLLRKRPHSVPEVSYGSSDLLESQGHSASKQRAKLSFHLRKVVDKGRHVGHTAMHPEEWDRKVIWSRGVVYPVSLLPAVLLGLLLNILDALSYGMILFPLGTPLFSDLGSDGISMFYVSTVVAQLVYSLGGSIFKGGIGSEMIEVVPFFHKMAFTILKRVGEDNPKAVLATTILAYSCSSIITGLVFLLMGAFKLGSLIGFFPRHILIGCIGGVGWFLVATGVEVSARLSGNLEYNLVTLKELFQGDTVALWTVPLALAIALLVIKHFIKSDFLVGGYFLGIGAIFYICKFAFGFDVVVLRDQGWVFDAPTAGNPWWHFYTLYDFGAVDWKAFVETIPAMFALTFFGVLHVPINVPALGISTGEDNLSVNRELIAHGISNAVSGCMGSIQNYLVYTNSLLFIGSGGNHRLAGVMLAIGTFGLMLIGPIIIGYIPVMVVGALIFMLGIELVAEALVDTWGKVHRLEYLTILIIVITMGAHDFVVGILVGIVLACLNSVVQNSRKSAIRATYSGQVATSTVRRHPLQCRYLQEAGQQTYIIKLHGFLFFGTIVSVEKRIRALLDEEAFTQQPIRFLLLDFVYVSGIDFSAAEAFVRLNRILRKRGVQMVISGLDEEGEVGQALRNVGLFSEDAEVSRFEDLNSALEHCENHLLRAFYHSRQQLTGHAEPVEYLTVPKAANQAETLNFSPNLGSPRRDYLHKVAETTLHNSDTASHHHKYSNYKQPLPLLLTALQGYTDKNETFWHPACAYFKHEAHTTGTALFRDGEPAQGFYLLESGMLRAEYHIPQGRFSELIVAGRPCGELPFFSETDRTATVTAERDCTVWILDTDGWDLMQKEKPDVARELLKVVLNLTSERMRSITSYVLVAAA